MRAGDVLRGGGVLLRGGDACLVPGVRFSLNVLRSITPVFAVSSRCLMFAHACCLPHCAKQDGLRDVAFLFRRGSRSPIVRSRGVGAVICLGGFISGLYVSLWRSRRVTGTWGTELRGGRGWRRGLCASLRNRIGLVSLSAGRTLGLRAPDCAKESSTLWTLLRGWPSEEVRFARRGCVGADSPRRHPGTIGDLTGSDKRRPHCGWPGRSCGRSNIAVRTIA